MLIIDSLIIGGIKFVLGKLASAVDAELHDDATLRQRLLEAQMRVELGEMSEEEFAREEADILARLRAFREERGEVSTPAGLRVTGVEAYVHEDVEDR